MQFVIIVDIAIELLLMRGSKSLTQHVVCGRLAIVADWWNNEAVNHICVQIILVEISCNT